MAGLGFVHGRRSPGHRNGRLADAADGRAYRRADLRAHLGSARTRSTGNRRGGTGAYRCFFARLDYGHLARPCGSRGGFHDGGRIADRPADYGLLLGGHIVRRHEFDVFQDDLVGRVRVGRGREGLLQARGRKNARLSWLPGAGGGNDDGRFCSLIRFQRGDIVTAELHCSCRPERAQVAPCDQILQLTLGDVQQLHRFTSINQFAVRHAFFAP
jgi:hypothetical protein